MRPGAELEVRPRNLTRLSGLLDQGQGLEPELPAALVVTARERHDPRFAERARAELGLDGIRALHRRLESPSALDDVATHAPEVPEGVGEAQLALGVARRDRVVERRRG